VLVYFVHRKNYITTLQKKDQYQFGSAVIVESTVLLELAVEACINCAATVKMSTTIAAVCAAH
jgi:hypothetical protein